MSTMLKSTPETRPETLTTATSSPLFAPASRAPLFRFGTAESKAAETDTKHQEALHKQAKFAAAHISRLNAEVSRLGQLVATQERQLKLLRSQQPTDATTGLMSAYALGQALRSMLTDFGRYGYRAATVCLDINDFRHLNTTYGRAAGDAALRHVASLLTRSCRDTDIIARPSDDTFVLILKDADAAFGNTRAHQIVAALAAAPLQFNGLTLHLTASLGVVTFQEAPEATELLQLAEHRMRAARRRARTETR